MTNSLRVNLFKDSLCDQKKTSELILQFQVTCTRASSPREEQDSVGVVPRNPESVTSSTVSPMDNTKVAFTKDTMMYESYSAKVLIHC